MRLDSVKVLEISITKNPKKEILEFLQKYLEEGSSDKGQATRKTIKSLTIVTPNPEQIVYAKRDPHFAEILNRADVSLPDGVGVVWASRQISPKPLTGVIPGVDFMEELVSWASVQHVPIALIGGWGGLAVKAFDRLHKKHQELVGWAEDGPEVRIVERQEAGNRRQGADTSLVTCHLSLVTSSGNEKDYFDQLAKRIIDSGVRMVFVGLGAPKQEYFIEKLQATWDRIQVNNDEKKLVSGSLSPVSCIFMSVGGSFDEISGSIPRAPGWVSRHGLKWVWRLVLEPWRIQRQLALLKFMWLVLGGRLSPRAT
jgi:N-acetylglucosaminyldiphosphoundecaprenol N-acetyl-beta-D-mannosaminyltransferase